MKQRVIRLADNLFGGMFSVEAVLVAVALGVGYVVVFGRQPHVSSIMFVHDESKLKIS